MAKPLAQMPYQTVGDLMLTFPHARLVSRTIAAISISPRPPRTCCTRADGITFAREVFASAPDQVIVVRLTASRPGQISFEARMQTPQRATVEATAEGDLVMRGINGDGRGTTADGRPIPGALRFEARVRVITTGGSRIASDEAIVVRDADAVTLLIAAATSYRRLRRRQRRSGGKRRDITRPRVRARHRQPSGRARPRLSATLRSRHARSRPARSRRVPPTSACRLRRRRRSAAGRAVLPVRPLPADRQLPAGPQPANLQGIWNDSMSPPWGSKYTININTEMNYWPARRRTSRRRWTRSRRWCRICR